MAPRRTRVHRPLGRGEGGLVRLGRGSPHPHPADTDSWVILLAASADGGDATLTFSGAFFADQQHAIVINLSLFLFNLFCPAYPLDGGRILVSCMLLCGVPVGTTANITVAVSAIFGLLIICLGAVYLNFLTIFVGGWVCNQAWELYQVVRQGRLDLHPIFHKYANDARYSGSAGSAGNNGSISSALGGRV